MHVAFAAAVAFATMTAVLATPELHKVRLIAHHTFPGTNVTNYFYRSNVPITCAHKHNVSSCVMDYAKLTGFMAQRAANASLAFPMPMYVTDLNTLNEFKVDERDSLRVEKAFFAANPRLGKFVAMEILGSLLDPIFMSEGSIKKLLPEYAAKDPDHLAARIPMIHTMLHTNLGHSNAILVHCEGGDDRTGEVSAAYVMMYQNQTLRQAIEWDRSISRRHIEVLSSNEVQWWCWYLTFSLGYTGLNCHDFPK
jgi:protein-tyrosine phosphatase